MKVRIRVTCHECNCTWLEDVNTDEFFVDDWLVLARKEINTDDKHVPTVNTEMWDQWDYNDTGGTERFVLARARNEATNFVWHAYCAD